MTFIHHTGPNDAAYHLVLAHGAGAGINSPFMTDTARLLAASGIRLTLIEFSYMVQRRAGGTRRPPPKIEILTQEYAHVLESVSAQRRAGQALFIGGKSLGGRVASMFADDAFKARTICGLICLGYPFHPPGKPENLRTAHLARLKCPSLIVQGERDPFGNRTEVQALALAPVIQLHWLPDGDHDFGPRGASGLTRKENIVAAASAVVAFMMRQGRASD